MELLPSAANESSSNGTRRAMTMQEAGKGVGQLSGSHFCFLKPK